MRILAKAEPARDVDGPCNLASDSAISANRKTKRSLFAHFGHCLIASEILESCQLQLGIAKRHPTQR